MSTAYTANFPPLGGTTQQMAQPHLPSQAFPIDLQHQMFLQAQMALRYAQQQQGSAFQSQPTVPPPFLLPQLTQAQHLAALHQQMVHQQILSHQARQQMQQSPQQV